MKRRNFLSQAVILPVLAASPKFVKASRSGPLTNMREFCFDGEYIEFELIIGTDIARAMPKSNDGIESIKGRVQDIRDRLGNSGVQMPMLRIHDTYRAPHPSPREYCFWVFGVIVYANRIDVDVPELATLHPKALRQHFEQIYFEIEKVAKDHQHVWAAFNCSTLQCRSSTDYPVIVN